MTHKTRQHLAKSFPNISVCAGWFQLAKSREDIVFHCIIRSHLSGFESLEIFFENQIQVLVKH